MRKPKNIARHSPGLTLAALTTVTILALGHVALAQAQVVTPSWTAATALPTLQANGKIAFTSDRDGNSEIYVMNPDGSNQVRLTNNSVVDDNAEWSPDGRRIAFVSQRPSGGYAICTMNADGTNKVEVTLINIYIATDVGAMSWSPDGSRIAFQDDYNVFVVNVDGSNRRNLTNNNNTSWDIQPSWSPDGSKILFTRLQGAPWLYTVKPDGTDLRALPIGSADGFGDFSPKWSPSGDKIVFLVNVWDFYIVVFTANADGANRQLLDGCPNSYCPDADDRAAPHWSPDGTKVVFHISNRFHTREDIYRRNTDGTGFVQLTDGPGRNINPSWQPLLPAACPNPIDCKEFFVRQHYLDFLNRQPDTDGLAFWTNEITLCGGNQQCIDAKRINVSAAYFLSIEFQETGYLVYRTYKASFGNLPNAPVPIKFNEFLPDTQQIGQGVIVTQAGWEQLLENNKQSFFSDFVQRSRFTSAYPTSMSSEQFVDQLFLNAGVTPSATDRAAAINEFPFAASTADVAARARALRRVAENSTLQQQEFNHAFVLMQYFGYLRRNPDDPPEPTLDFQGYNFWLNKLNQFSGNFIQAEMVKAFLVSTEYRQRFGP